MKIIHRYNAFLIAVCFAASTLLGQSSGDNYVVFISKSSLRPMAQVEDGSGEERKELFEEYAREMNPLTTELKMAMTLGHYWSNTSTDVLQINTYESIADADQAGKNEAKTRERAWRRDDVREEFFKKFNKYWVRGHTDLELMQLVPDRTKVRKRKAKENTVVTLTRYYLAPLSNVDGGSAEERKELLDKHFEDVVMNNDKLLSQMVLSHYWSGELGYGKGWPIIYVREWVSFTDAEDNESWTKAREEAWPDEEDRKAAMKRFREYWSGGVHEDMGIYYNLVNLQK